VADPAVLAWHALDPAAARSLELAHQTLLAGGLAVGSVIMGEDGAIVAEGRNRAYDEASGTDVLERTPLAHAEMNALARITTGADTGRLTIWSTQQPCRMCQAAIEFVGIGQTVAIATDPSDPQVRVVERLPDDWVVLATAMFLVAPVRRGGPEHPMVQANRALEPEALALAERVAQGDHPLIDGRPLAAAIGVVWDELQRAASDRRRRRERGLG
jgi:tRNA(Arg) A34 adenosine deaminase TadA